MVTKRMIKKQYATQRQLDILDFELQIPYDSDITYKKAKELISKGRKK